MPGYAWPVAPGGSGFTDGEVAAEMAVARLVTSCSISSLEPRSELSLDPPPRCDCSHDKVSRLQPSARSRPRQECRHGRARSTSISIRSHARARRVADSAPWMLDMVGTIDAPVDRVWATFTDNPSWAKWFDGCTSCESTSSPAHGVGSTRTIRVSGLKVDERFIAWESERLWAFTVVNLRPAFASGMIERATFTELEGTCTRIDYRVAIAPRRWASPLRKVIAKRLTAAFESSFRKLNAHMLARS